MKPSLIKPNQRLARPGNPRVYVVVERDAAARVTTCRCEDFAGLDGPHDTGMCTISDADMAGFELVTNAADRAA
jgi:hypothetical protein